MFRPFSAFVSVVSFVSLVSLAAPVAAQPADVVGVRASGMGGAFTAVADDATASWWNPAGMAGGAYFNALLESGTHREPPDDRTTAGNPQSAWRADLRSLAVAFPALGLSYYRLRFSEMQPETSTGTVPGSRQEGGAAEVRVRSIVLNQFGASVGQSLGSHLVVGSTVKLVNGGAVTQVQPAGTGSLDAATGLDPSGDTRLGLDVGAMGVLGPFRVGVMVRNVTRPEFGNGADAFTLDRQARIGAALTSGSRGVIGQATVAVDGDLTTTPTVLGDERRIAVGGELWTVSRVIGIRGGVSVNTIGTGRTALSGGASAALKKGLYADGELTGGTDSGRRGWGVGLRVTF
jgi:F plasmid transfer operon protein TraF